MLNMSTPLFFIEWNCRFLFWNVFLSIILRQTGTQHFLFILFSYFEGFVFLWRVYRGGEREFTPTHTSNFVVWVDLEGPVIYFFLSLWLSGKLVWHFVNKGCVQSSFYNCRTHVFQFLIFFKKYLES